MKSLHSVVFYLTLLFVSGKVDKKKESEKNVLNWKSSNFERKELFISINLQIHWNKYVKIEALNVLDFRLNNFDIYIVLNCQSEADFKMRKHLLIVGSQ